MNKIPWAVLERMQADQPWFDDSKQDDPEVKKPPFGRARNIKKEKVSFDELIKRAPNL